MRVPPWTVDDDNTRYTLVNVILKERGWSHWMTNGLCEYSLLSPISPIFVIFHYWVVNNVLLNCTFQSLVYDIDFFSSYCHHHFSKPWRFLSPPRTFFPSTYTSTHVSITFTSTCLSTIWVHHHLFIHPLLVCISSGLFCSDFSSEIKHLMAPQLTP